MAVFVSYARQNRDTVIAMRDALAPLGRELWLDQKLRGGDEWWSKILAQIRECDVFLWTVSPESVRSHACLAELEYAVALGRPILPVRIKDVAEFLLPRRIALAQITDYSQPNATQAFQLAGDLQAMALAPALPDPLPAPPPVPITYIDNLVADVASPEPMSPDRQRQIVHFLGGVIGDADHPEDANTALSLLSKLHDRSEITLESSQAIDRILSQVSAAAEAPEPTSDPSRTHRDPAGADTTHARRTVAARAAHMSGDQAEGVHVQQSRRGPDRTRLKFVGLGALTLVVAVVVVSIVALVGDDPSSDGGFPAGDMVEFGAADAAVSLDKGGLDVTLPPGSEGVEAGAAVRCNLEGDFDVRARYELHEWPEQNGGRVGLIADLGMERTSEGNQSGDELYAFHDAQDELHQVPTEDRSGELRLQRVGTTFTGWARSDANADWKEIGSSDGDRGSLELSLQVWGDDASTPNSARSVSFTALDIRSNAEC